LSDERSATRTDVRIGARLRSRRLDRGLSQEKLADLLGLTFQQVQKYEKGVNRIAASRLYDIAVVLETPITYFFEGLSEPSDGDPAQPEGVAITSEEIELLRLFRSFSERIKRKVFALIKAMKD